MNVTNETDTKSRDISIDVVAINEKFYSLFDMSDVCMAQDLTFFYVPH